MRRIPAVLLVLLMLSPLLRAQHTADTLARRLPSDFKATQLIAPAVLLGAGFAVHYAGHEPIETGTRDFVFRELRGETLLPDLGTYLQYVPLTLHLGLGMVGGRPKHALADRAIESAIAHLFCGCGSFVAKRVFDSLRPDGSSNNSFPSGHTSLVFTGAELMRMDYGNAWGAGAYVLSSAVAASRLYYDRHWLGDILAGAGWGILCAHAGGWLLKPVKRLFGIPELGWDGLRTRKAQIAFVPCVNPVSGAYSASLSVVF